MSSQQSSSVFWLSPAQATIWSGQAGGPAWNAAAAVVINGPVQVERLRHALRRLIQRNEILRTVFLTQTAIKLPFQQILESSEPLFDSSNLSGLPDREQKERVESEFQALSRHAFDLQQGPLVLARYFQLAPERAVLFFVVPALLADAATLDLAVSELAASYAGDAIPGQDVLRYVQFAQWQSDILDSDDENASSAKAFWEEMRAAGSAALPLSDSRHATDNFRPATVSANAKIDFGCLNAVPATVLHAAWQTVLYRLAGTARFTTRMFLDGREYEELNALLGPVGKFVPVPARLDGEFSFREVLERLERAQAEAAQWQEYFRPGNGAEEGLAISFEFARQVPIRHGGITFTLAKRSTTSERFALKLSAVQSEDALEFDLHYDASRFGQGTARCWLGHFLTLLQGALAEPEIPVSRLPILTAAERKQILVTWNNTQTEYPNDLCFHRLFESQVERTPERPAARAGAGQLTYSELNRRANRLAHFLSRAGIGPGSRVGLAVDRSVDALAALLAVLKAGAAYVPLNPDNPKARLSRQLRIADALITESKLVAALPDFSGFTIELDRDAQKWDLLPAANPGTRVSPDDLCYIIFTSGSTGDPKAVAVRHRNLVNYATFIARRLELEACPDQLQFASVSTLSADLGNTCIFPALLSGGCVHLISHNIAADPVAFAAYQREFPVDVLKIVPSHLTALLDSAEAPSLLPRKVLVTGGEPLSPQLVEHLRALHPRCAILNHYGPTETTIGSLTFPLTLEDAPNGPVPVGRPIANTRAYILDCLLEPVPVGVRGDLYIAGDGVSAGYLNDPDLTADRFVDDPFAGGKMYRTGDHASYREDGNIVFLGRQDNQVKVRGFRVELGEIEAALLRHPGVKQAVVVVRNASSTNVIAYVVPRQERQLVSNEIRDFLRAELPDYMIPGVIGLLPKLPLTANGKLDRANLPEPVEAGQRSRVAPRSDIEEGVLAIWTEVFRRDDLGVQDDFFDLGGHSLMAAQVMSRVRERFNVVLEMRILFQFPTVEGVAGAVLSAAPAPSSAEPEIVPVGRALYRRK